MLKKVSYFRKAADLAIAKLRIAQDHRLGRVSDIQLGKAHGVAHDVVTNVRRLMGVEAHRARVNWKLHDHMLGKVPDGQLAKQIGCVRQTVRDRRMKLKIANYKVAKPKQHLNWPRPNGREIDEARRGRLA